jgi:thioredoxin reductase (NADPH)
VNLDRSAPLRETPDTYGAFPRLSDAQIAVLAEHGERRPMREGDVLFREGEVNDELFVILEGEVAIVEGYGGTERLIGVHGRGRFLGELNLFTGQASFTTAVAREPGEVLAVPAERLRQVVSTEPSLADLLLRACLVRRSMLIGLGSGIKIVGSRHSPDSRRLRDFVARNRLPHAWIDVEEDETAESYLRGLGVSPEETPLVVVSGRKILRNPSNDELARAIGLRAPSSDDAACDLLIVGAGPAGLAAAVYGASEGLATIVLDGVATGGQASTTSRIENYLGFPTGISGVELADRAVIQAERFGARIDVPAEATSLEGVDGHHVVKLDTGGELRTRTVLIATGARYRRLALPRLEELEGTSVYYAATPMEAQLCLGDPVVVVGGGNSAGQATMFLREHAARVCLVLREDELTENMSRYLADRIESSPDVDVRRHSEVRELIGEKALEAVVVEDLRTRDRDRVDARALFVFIGADPHTGWLAGEIELDEGGFVRTGIGNDGGCGRLLETGRPGVFAAGDVRSGSTRRVASAAGEGAMAVRLVHEHLSGQHEQQVAQTKVSSA